MLDSALSGGQGDAFSILKHIRLVAESVAVKVFWGKSGWSAEQIDVGFVKKEKKKANRTSSCVICFYS